MTPDFNKIETLMSTVSKQYQVQQSAAVADFQVWTQKHRSTPKLLRTLTSKPPGHQYSADPILKVT